jgi:hypothetical protein
MYAGATINVPLLVSVVMFNIVPDAPQGCPLYARRHAGMLRSPVYPIDTRP